MRLLFLLIFLASCSPLGLLTGLGGGPSATAIGTQLGKENTQQIVASQTKQEAGRDIVSKQVEAQSVEKLTVNNQNTSIWMVLLLIIGWVLPSPNEIAKWILQLFGKK